MASLRIFLESSMGNLRIGIGKAFNVVINISHEKDKEGFAELIYDSKLFLLNAKTKIQKLGKAPFSKVKWKLIPLKRIENQTSIKILVREEGKVQMCTFMVKIL